MKINLYTISLFLVIYLVYAENNEIKSARLESCPGCQLNRLPEVKQFVYEDIPKYENVEFKKIQGHPPEIVFLNSEDEEVERISLSPLSRQECNDLLVKRGFNLKSKIEF